MEQLTLNGVSQFYICVEENRKLWRRKKKYFVCLVSVMCFFRCCLFLFLYMFFLNECVLLCGDMFFLKGFRTGF